MITLLTTFVILSLVYGFILVALKIQKCRQVKKPKVKWKSYKNLLDNKKKKIIKKIKKIWRNKIKV